MWIYSRAPITCPASLGVAEGSRACREELKGRSKSVSWKKGSALRDEWEEIPRSSWGWARIQWFLGHSFSQVLKNATLTEAKAGRTSTWKPCPLP